MPPTILNGTPGQSFTNTGPKVLYQMLVSWHNSCGTCCQFDRGIGPYFPIPLHRGCRCQQRIVKPGDTAEPFVDFREKIAELDHKQQGIVVGRSNLTLIDRGVVDWSDVVTPSRVRDLREVVARKKLTVDAMVKAGVNPRIATDAHASVHTPEHELAAAHRQKLIDNLTAKGVTRQQVKEAFGKGIAGRVGIGTGPSGPQALPIKPTPPPPPANISPVVAKVLGVKPPKPGRPTGPPVSRAFTITPHAQRAEIEATIRAIDSVHGAVRLPTIPVEPTNPSDPNQKYIQGQFGWGRGGPVGIRLKEGGQTPRMTFAHETGHFLEAAAIDGGIKDAKFRDWENDPAFSEWTKAIRASEAFRTLRDAAGKASPVYRGWLDYATGYNELWARSYAQFIATRSGDAAMLAELDKARTPRPYEEYIPTQWDDSDFADISAAIDAMFRKLGWIAP